MDTKEFFKQKVLTNLEMIQRYVELRPDSDLAKVIDFVGLLETVKYIERFAGKTVTLSFPSMRSLRRVVMPLVIQNILSQFETGSVEFNEAVKALGKEFGRTKRAIREMNQTGKHCR